MYGLSKQYEWLIIAMLILIRHNTFEMPLTSIRLEIFEASASGSQSINKGILLISIPYAAGTLGLNLIRRH
jgi:hypothetical protein